jgi:hypothetical protein
MSRANSMEYNVLDRSDGLTLSDAFAKGFCSAYSINVRAWEFLAWVARRSGGCTSIVVRDRCRDSLRTFSHRCTVKCAGLHATTPCGLDSDGGKAAPPRRAAHGYAINRLPLCAVAADDPCPHPARSRRKRARALPAPGRLCREATADVVLPHVNPAGGQDGRA